MNPSKYIVCACVNISYLCVSMVSKVQTLEADKIPQIYTFLGILH